MKISKRLLWFGLRSCLYCGSLERHSDGLCKTCSEDLWSWQNADEGLFTQKIEKLEVSTLFHWVPGQQEVLSRLVRALKGEGGAELWRFYAEEFWQRRLQTFHDAKVRPMLLIPSPSLENRKDHAALWAEALADISGASLYPCLRRAQQSSQKQKTRSERFRVSLEWSESFTSASLAKNRVGRQIVFVDDVVTTGATAHAAWKSLGKPRDFAVWALAQRGLSCGACRDLV